MLICTALYLVVATAAIGARPVGSFAASPEPLALILRELGQGTAAKWIGASAVVALPTVLLAFLFGQSRIFLGMARDGLLPTRLAKISSRGVPALVTIFTAVVVASGIVEIAFGVALVALPKERRRIGAALAAFYVAIFPGNVDQWRKGRSAFGLDTDRRRFARLFFQPVLVAAAWWSTR